MTWLLPEFDALGQASAHRSGDDALSVVRGRRGTRRNGDARPARAVRARRPALGGRRRRCYFCAHLIRTERPATSACRRHLPRDRARARSSAEPASGGSAARRRPDDGPPQRARRKRDRSAAPGRAPGIRSTSGRPISCALLRVETAGNPFFIGEVFADLAESGVIHREGERWTTDLPTAELEVPEGLRQVIEQRVGRLSAPARRAVAAAAVAGPTCTLALLEQVLDEEPELIAALEQAVAAGLLIEAGAAGYVVRARPGAPDDLSRARRGAADAATPSASARRSRRWAAARRMRRPSRIISRRRRPMASPPRLATTRSPPGAARPRASATKRRQHTTSGGLKRSHSHHGRTMNGAANSFWRSPKCAGRWATATSRAMRVCARPSWRSAWRTPRGWLGPR